MIRARRQELREIVLDTETTGLDPFAGHRLVEIGAIELLNRMPSGRHFHRYLNPERDVPAEAFAVHGLSAEFLNDKPRFGEIAEDLLAFIEEAPLIAHNAAFDLGFLNAELERVGKRSVGRERLVDTLLLARRKHPAGPNRLDDLCARYGIDNSRRTKHGALLDAEILAEVYLDLIDARQAPAHSGRGRHRCDRHARRGIFNSPATDGAGRAFVGRRARGARSLCGHSWAECHLAGIFGAPAKRLQGGRRPLNVPNRCRGYTAGTLVSACASRRGRSLPSLHLRHSLLIEGDEIYGIEEKRREAAVAHCRCHDLARERKQEPRTFDHDKGLQAILAARSEPEKRPRRSDRRRTVLFRSCPPCRPA